MKKGRRGLKKVNSNNLNAPKIIAAGFFILLAVVFSVNFFIGIIENKSVISTTGQAVAIGATETKTIAINTWQSINGIPVFVSGAGKYPESDNTFAANIIVGAKTTLIKGRRGIIMPNGVLGRYERLTLKDAASTSALVIVTDSSGQNTSLSIPIGSYRGGHSSTDMTVFLISKTLSSATIFAGIAKSLSSGNDPELGATPHVKMNLLWYGLSNTYQLELIDATNTEATIKITRTDGIIPTDGPDTATTIVSITPPETPVCSALFGTCSSSTPCCSGLTCIYPNSYTYIGTCTTCSANGIPCLSSNGCCSKKCSWSWTDWQVKCRA